MALFISLGFTKMNFIYFVNFLVIIWIERVRADSDL